MTRVALVPSAYLPDLGGVEEMSHQLARALVAGGDTVEVWTAKVPATGVPLHDRIDGIEVHRLPYPLPALRPGALARFPFAGWRAFEHLRRAVRRYRPDLVHVQCFGPNGVYATALSQWTDLPLVVTLHGETVTNDNRVFERSAVLRGALRYAMSHATAVTGCSAFALHDAVERFGLDPDRGQVVFNGIDLGADPAGRDPTEEDPLAPAVGTGTAAPAASAGSGPALVVAVGRMVEMKGFDLLLDAFARVAPSHPASRLVLAGDGRARSALEAQAERLGLNGQVQFPGRLSRDQVGALLRRAALSVLPSRLESFGLVVLEAWQAGLPVVATTRGGPPEFVTEGVDGLLVDPFDTSALASALDRLLGDPARCHRMGEAGRRRVGQFGWPEVADRYREIYARALASSSR